MWGHYKTKQGDSYIEDVFDGYVGFVQLTGSDGEVRNRYICEAVSQTEHDRGGFELETDMRGVFRRCDCAFFDSPSEVRQAVEVMKVPWVVEKKLVKVIKATFTSMLTFEDIA